MSEAITGTRTLADLVIEVPSRAAVLEGHGLDYCCAGDRTLARACDDAGLGLEQVTAELERAEPAHQAVPNDITGLIEHILEQHHGYLNRELGRLAALAAKVVRVHGARHPDLMDLHAAVLELQADLEPHLVKEELVLFPACRALDAPDAPTDFAFGSISNPIRALIAEHHDAGALLDRLAEHLARHPLPDDACESYTALYHAIPALITDTHEHVFEENHILFPAVLEREQQRATPSGTARRASA